MTQVVDVPLLNPAYSVLYPLLIAFASLVKGLVVGAVATFAAIKLSRRPGGATPWRAALATGGALLLAVTAGSWLLSSDYTWIRITPNEIELRYVTWPRPARRIALTDVESVSMSTSGRRQPSRHLVITTKATRWESAAANEQRVALAIQWIDHASGGRVKHSSAAAATR